MTVNLEKETIVNIDQIIGATAMWAIRQSPYEFPDHFQAALEQLRLTFLQEDGWDSKGWKTFTGLTLLSRLETYFRRNLLIVTWNRSKSGHSDMVFVSRYGGPKADDDFIDLDALARNVVMTLWREDL